MTSSKAEATNDHSALIELVEHRIGQDFDGECHLTEAEARQVAAALRDLTAVRKVHPSEAPDANGFIPWHGGQNPCRGRRVDAVWLGDVHYDHLSDELDWEHSDICDPITAYRPLPSAPNQAKEAGE